MRRKKWREKQHKTKPIDSISNPCICCVFACCGNIEHLATQKAADIHHCRTNTSDVDIFHMLLVKFMQHTRSHTHKAHGAVQSKRGKKHSDFGFIYCIQITVFKWKWSCHLIIFIFSPSSSSLVCLLLFSFFLPMILFNTHTYASAEKENNLR